MTTRYCLVVCFSTVLVAASWWWAWSDLAERATGAVCFSAAALSLIPLAKTLLNAQVEEPVDSPSASDHESTA